jgi:hypothetical protein
MPLSPSSVIMDDRAKKYAVPFPFPSEKRKKRGKKNL